MRKCFQIFVNGEEKEESWITLYKKLTYNVKKSRINNLQYKSLSSSRIKQKLVSFGLK